VTPQWMCVESVQWSPNHADRQWPTRPFKCVRLARHTLGRAKLRLDNIADAVALGALFKLSCFAGRHSASVPRCRVDIHVNNNPYLWWRQLFHYVAFMALHPWGHIPCIAADLFTGSLKISPAKMYDPGLPLGHAPFPGFTISSAQPEFLPDCTRSAARLGMPRRGVVLTTSNSPLLE